jgi:alkyldihydroxyacetonephosphate synthase
MVEVALGSFAVAVVVLVAVVLTRRARLGAELDSSYDLSEGERHPHRWGYTDTKFVFEDSRTVRVTGSRYPLSGYSMPHFTAFAEDVLQVPITPEEVEPEVEHQAVPEPRIDPAFLAAVRARLAPDQVSVDPEDRLIHSHGQLSVDEIFRLLYSGPLDRCADLVLYPADEEEVRSIVQLADRHGACLIPYGGGTNVSGALTCPVAEQRPIASVDLRRMDRVVSLDEQNLFAVVEAGISGKQLEKVLGERGYTCGHDPDSVELSTLGGWIATNASGMKKNRYGNIEDLVLEATLVTPTGDIAMRAATPRNSVGIPPRVFLFGSEGNLGIITKAVIKVFPLPQVRRYGSLVFPSFAHGVRFLKALRQEGAMPASIRLVNNFEFRFGQALRPAPGFWKGLTARVQKLVLLKVMGFKPLEMAACIVVAEGSPNEVANQRKVIAATAKKHGGISGGASNGKRGYTLTFGIAYIRDFFNQFHLLGETFETSVPWDRIHPVCEAVQHELVEQCRQHAVRGRPYLSYRVTQTYHTGVCIYFTMGFSGKGLAEPVKTYHDVEGRLRQVILDQGGSLSHHHGVGKIRQRFLPQIQTENTAQVMRQLKKAMDPHDVFGARNGVFVEPS